MDLKRLMGAIFLCLLLFVSRFIPHPDNFTPFIALSLFMGFFCKDRWWALLLPMVAMGLSDLKLGLYPGWAFVYIPFVLAVFYGFFLKAKSLSVFSFAVVASLSFFAISNFGVWLYSGMYPPTFSGLMTCYMAAIPFLHRTLLSTVFYSFVIFSAAVILLGSGERKQITT